MKLPKMSLAVLALTGALSVGTSAFGQATNSAARTNAATGARQGAARQGGRGMTVEAQMTRLTELLKLTDAQKPKVKAVLEEETKKRQEMRGDTAMSQEDRRGKMQTMREETTKKMKEILTPEQFKTYEENAQQQRGRRGQGGRGGGAQ